MDATCTFPPSTSANVTGYQLTWKRNGTPLAPAQVIPRTAAQDAAGLYTSDIATAYPVVTIAPGDDIGVTCVALDATHNLQSTPISPPDIIEPVAAPLPPPSINLVAS
jgi:hypothetical protein